MTVSLESILRAVTQSAGLVDRSSVGRILVSGADRIDLLHRLSTNDLLSLKTGQTIDTAFTTDKGRMIDYVTVCVLESSLLLLTSSPGEQRFVEWVERYHIMEDIQFSIKTNKTAMATLVGTKAFSIGSAILGIELSPNTIMKQHTLWGESTVICIQAFGTSFVNLIVDVGSKSDLWNGLLSMGEPLGVRLMDAKTWEAYRISRGIPVTGREISEEFNPYDCGLSHAISYTKGCYIGQEVIARLETYNKIQRELIGVSLLGKPGDVSMKVPLRRSGEEIGRLTSVSHELIDGGYPGLAIVKKGLVAPGDRVTLNWATNEIEAAVTILPMDLSPAK